MNKKVVFISLPMNGLTYEYIQQNITKAQEVYLSLTGLTSEQVMFVDNFGCELDLSAQIGSLYGIKDGQESIWYLGKAICILSRCNEAFFWFGWRNARGCRIEHDVCETYGIPMVSVEGAYNMKEDI